MRCLPTLLASLLLAGCARDPVASIYADYLARLERVTGVEAPAEALATDTLRYPRGRERQLPVPEVSGSVLEIFRLSRCDIGQLLAQRNSILGRHADAAAHLAIDGRITQRLKQCREALNHSDKEDARLLARIDELLEEKSVAMRARAWNAGLGSQAMADWWSPSADALVPSEAGMPGDALEQLVLAVQAALEGKREQADKAFSQAYRQLERQRYGGAWLKAMQTSLAGLSAATTLLDTIDTTRLCPQQRPTPKARVLQTILQQRYFGNIQPLLAKLDRAGEAMHEALKTLWPADAKPPAAVATFRAQVWAVTEGGLGNRLLHESRSHAAAWKRVLQACGLGPAASASAR
ncbi:DUF3080 family protein [Algiphilus aromaticivorans]|uniref:DUF3080 family protein n=1 Tax=Algiphilus aromaticivorans TaxID=382454 RepID=UPI0005C13F53|nr:DUF3080 family protein [Algiphilus aromaticivorans]